MKRFKLFNEFNGASIYGEKLHEAVIHAEIKTVGRYDKDLQVVVDQKILDIKKTLGYRDTENSTRGNEKYLSVVVELKDGKRTSIDAMEMETIKF